MTARGKPTYEELEKKCALLQSKLAAMNELMNVVGKASVVVNMGIAELQSQKAELEARTVTVQLPADNAAESESPEDDATAWFDEGWNARGKADKEALIAAGIGVKGE